MLMTTADLAVIIERALDNMEDWGPNATYEEWTAKRDQLLDMMARLEERRLEERRAEESYDNPTSETD